MRLVSRVTRKLNLIFLSIGIVLASNSFVKADKTSEKIMVIIDGSGSMWGQIDGRPKIEIARSTIREVLPGIDQFAELGLMAYGHREEGQCDDIEAIVPLAPVQTAVPAILQALGTISPKGKTPLSRSVQKAAEELNYQEGKATVVLITDGLETCDADPCAVAQQLERLGVNFTTHVVGFGLSDDESDKVSCLADATGGLYVQAVDANRLNAALNQVLFQEPKPEKTYIQLFDTAAEKKVISGRNRLHGFSSLVVYRSSDFSKRTNGIEGGYGSLPASLRTDQHSDTAFDGDLEPGAYIALVKYKTSGGTQSVPLPFTVPEGADRVFRLYAGMASIAPKIVHVAGGRDWGFGGSGSNSVRVDYYPIVSDSSGDDVVWEQSVLTNKGPIPPGRYLARGSLGQARIEQEINVAAGSVWKEELIFNAALVEITFLHTDGKPVDGGIVVRFCSAEPREKATPYEDCRRKDRPHRNIHVNVGQKLRLALNREKQWNRTSATQIVTFPIAMAGKVIRHEIRVGELAFGSAESEFQLYDAENLEQ